MERECTPPGGGCRCAAGGHLVGPGLFGSGPKSLYNTPMTFPGPATTFWIAVFLFDLYAIARAVTRGHGVESTLAWIFAILALPAVGAGAYVLLANPSVRRTTRRKRL